MRPRNWRSTVRSTCTYFVLGFWSVVCLFPIYWVLITSLKSGTAIIDGPRYIPFFDFTPTLDAWKVVLTYTNDHLLLRFFNSAVVGVTSTLATLLFGALAVYGLTRFRPSVHWTRFTLLLLAGAFAGVAFIIEELHLQLMFTGLATTAILLVMLRRHPGPTMNYQGILFATLSTRLLPPVVVALPIYLMAVQTGTRDTHVALILTYTAINLPVAVWLLLPVFGDVATPEEESAMLDGASAFRICFEVLLPMIRPSIVAAGVVILVLCWNEYLFATYLTGAKVSTLPPWVMGQMSIKEAATGGDTEEWPQLSAAIVFMFAPMLAVTSFAMRILTRRVA